MEIELEAVAAPAAPRRAATIGLPAGGGGWIAPRIGDGDRLRGSGTGEMTTLVDTAALAGELRDVGIRADQIALSAVGEKRTRIEGLGIGIHTYANLAAFGQFQLARMPLAAAIGSLEYSLSLAQESSVTAAMARGEVRCLDIAIVAQAFLQQRGIPSTLVGGSIRWPGDNLIDGHAYLLLEHGGRHLVWDATNPIRTASGGHRPALYEMAADVALRLLRGDDVLAPCSLIYSADRRVEFGATVNGDFV